MVTGLIMVGAIAANKPEVDLTDITPIAGLTTEYAGDRGARRLRHRGHRGAGDAMRADIGVVSWAGGSAGGAEQILAGLVAKAVGPKPAR